MRYIAYRLLLISLIWVQIYGTTFIVDAQAPIEIAERKPLIVESGVYNGRETETYVAFREVIRYPGTPWIQLHFSEYNLGQNSFLVITSLLDEGQQRLEATTLPQWSNGSAFFNGEAVEIALHIAPGDTNIFFELAAVTVLKLPEPDDPELPEAIFKNLVGGAYEAICGGTDNRVASNDRRVGRLYFGGCTAWLTSNGSLLTAGHCVDFDPDRAGPLVPDGVLDLQGVVEFNVPDSQANGIPARADPNDQYPINLASVHWEHAGSSVADTDGDGIRDTIIVDSRGQDWAIFEVNPNAGLTPYQAQGGFFRLTQVRPLLNDDIRITGFGTDNLPAGPNLTSRPPFANEANFTNQTDLGTYSDEITINNGLQYQYVVDTEGANSGSPIIVEDTGFTIGIHTNGGCTTTSGANSGTSFRYQPLAQAIQNFHGPNTIYVDQATLSGVNEDGTVFNPFDTVAEGVNAANAGGIISVVAGTYPETLTIQKPVTIIAPVGTVTIGRE